MSKKRSRSRELVKAPTTATRVKIERNDNRLLWRIVTDHPDIFDTHVVAKSSVWNTRTKTVVLGMQELGLLLLKVVVTPIVYNICTKTGVLLGTKKSFATPTRTGTPPPPPPES